MVRVDAMAGALFLFSFTASAQEQSAPSSLSPSPMQHEHQGGFMQGGHHHSVAKGVALDAKVDSAARLVTIRVGPMTMPAHTSHTSMPQPPDFAWNVSFDGWLLAYHPRLVDESGGAVPGTLLHHTAFWNENRADFLCPNKEEHIFGAGSEMADWAELPGFGYRVTKGDQIRIETMIYNPTATSYDKVYLEVAIPYQELSSASGSSLDRRNIYPAWMDVQSCGNSSYDVPPGKSEKSGNVTVKYNGFLLGVGGHMHDYGKQLVLRDATRNETVATLDAKSDLRGHLESVPVKLFVQQGGYNFSAGDVLIISATYQNPTGRLLPRGAMGIAVGYFVPADESQMVALRRKTLASPDRTGISRDH